MRTRNRPAPPSPTYTRGHHHHLAAGFDTYAEAWNVKLLPAVVAKVAEAQQAALEVDDAGRGDPVEVEIGGMAWTVSPYGQKGGVKYKLETANAAMGLRSAACDWGVTLRYSSGGLWKHGIEALRAEYGDVIRALSVPVDPEDTEPVCSRFDFAWDYYSPDFTAEIERDGLTKDRFLSPAHTKGNAWWEGTRDQTWTVGKLPRLQVQLYDKGEEIKEASGKDWFRDLWRQKPELRAFIPPDGPIRDVWRIEARFGGEYLKERGIRGWHAIEARLPELLCAALADRRLTEASMKRRDLAPTHGMWFDAWQRAGEATTAPAITKLCTMRREEYRDVLMRGLAGTLLSLSVAEHGRADEEALAAFAKEAAEGATKRRDLVQQERKRRARYRWLGDVQ